MERVSNSWRLIIHDFDNALIRMLSTLLEKSIIRVCYVAESCFCAHGDTVVSKPIVALMYEEVGAQVKKRVVSFGKTCVLREYQHVVNFPVYIHFGKNRQEFRPRSSEMCCFVGKMEAYFAGG